MFKIKTKKTIPVNTLTSDKRIEAPESRKTVNFSTNQDVLKAALNHKPPMDKTSQCRPITANGSKPFKNGGLSNRRGTIGLKHSNSNNFNAKNQKRMNTQYNSTQQSYNLSQNLNSTIQSIFKQILRNNQKFNNLTQKQHEQLQRIKQKIKTRSQLIWLKVTISNNKKRNSQYKNQLAQNEEDQLERDKSYESTLKGQILKQIQKERRLVQASSQCNSIMGRIQSMIDNRLQRLSTYSIKLELTKA